MNIVQLQEQLKNFSQDQLVREMQSPSGSAPQFLVLGEIMRRQKMQQDFATQQAKGQPQSTVAEEAVAAAGVPQGGIADMARALAPKTDMTGNTGVQAMATGGSVKKMKAGDIVVRNGRRLIEQEDGTYKDERGRRVLTPAQDIREGIATLRSIPSRLGAAARDFSAEFANQMNADLTAAGDTALRRQMAENAFNLRAGPDTSYRYPPVPTPDMSGIDNVAMALEGRTGFPTGMPTREEEAIAARNELLGGLVNRFDQQAAQEELMSAGGGRAGFRTGFPQGVSAPKGFVPLDVLAERIAQGEAAREMRAGPMTAMPAPPGVVAPQYTADTIFDPMLGVPISGGGVEGETPAVEAPKEQGPAFEREGRGGPTLDELIALEESRAADAAAATQSSGGGGGGGGIAGAGGMSDYEKQLMDMISRREKAAQQDKWLALAQVGLNMMASKEPTFLGAVGEAGLKGVETARSARDQYDKDRMELLGALEQSRMARAELAARAARAAAGGASGLGISAGAARLLTQITADIDRLSGVVNDPFTLNAIQAGEATPEQELAYAAAQQKLNDTIALREQILYGGAIAPQEEDDLNIDAADQ